MCSVYGRDFSLLARIQAMRKGQAARLEDQRERLLFVTDLPWFDEQRGVGALLSMSISDEDVHNTCRRNAEELLGL